MTGLRTAGKRLNAFAGWWLTLIEDRANSKRIYLSLLALLCLFHFLANVVILSRDGIPPVADQEDHFHRAVQLSAYLDIYPPIFFVAAQPLIWTLGKTWDAVALTNSFFFVLLIVCVYGIGAQAAGRFAGLVSAITLSFLPGIFGGSRDLNLDFSMTALSAAALYALFRSDGFRKRAWFLVFCGTLGAAQMAKQPVPIYLTAPIAIDTVRHWRNWWSRSFLPWLGAGILIFVFVISPWYFTHLFSSVTRIMKINAEHAEIGVLTLGKIKALWFAYLSNLPVRFEYLIGLGLAIFCLSTARHRLEIAAWLVAPFLILPYFFNEERLNPRYTMPMLPAAALIVGIALVKGADRYRGMRRRWRRSLRGARLLAVFVLLSFLAVSFGVTSFGPVPPDGWVADVSDRLASGRLLHAYPEPAVYPEVSNAVSRLQRELRRPLVVLTIPGMETPISALIRTYDAVLNTMAARGQIDIRRSSFFPSSATDISLAIANGIAPTTYLDELERADLLITTNQIVSRALFTRDAASSWEYRDLLRLLDYYSAYVLPYLERLWAEIDAGDWQVVHRYPNGRSAVSHEGDEAEILILVRRTALPSNLPAGGTAEGEAAD